jgi:CBS domain-containing protein
MKVQDVMTRVVHTCRPEDSLEMAAGLLWERDCGCLPVVDGEGHVQAIITDRDICMAAYTQGRRLGDLRVADSMSQKAVTCRPEDDVAEAARKMCEHEIRRLPVVDRDRKVRGVLSLNDLILAADADCAALIDDVAGSKAWMVLASVSRHRPDSPASAPTQARTDSVRAGEPKPPIPQSTSAPASTKLPRPQPRA